MEALETALEMALNAALTGVSKLFLDSAPVIYHVECHPGYGHLVKLLFESIERGDRAAVTSPVTLAECRVGPYRAELPEVGQTFLEVVLHGRNTRFQAVDEAIGIAAARIRSDSGLALADAMQVAVAQRSGCQAIVTNDKDMRRVREPRPVLLNDVLLDAVRRLGDPALRPPCA